MSMREATKARLYRIATVVGTLLVLLEATGAGRKFR
jgi:hypothetical protein